MSFNPALHPRVPKGAAGGGQFGTAKGKAPAPSKQPSKKTGNRYTKTQFKQLQSLERQHQAGKNLTAAQAHSLHEAHVLHEQHVANQRAAAKPSTKVKPAKLKTAGKVAVTKTAKPGRVTTAQRNALAASVAKMGK